MKTVSYNHTLDFYTFAFMYDKIIYLFNTYVLYDPKEGRLHDVNMFFKFCIFMLIGAAIISQLVKNLTFELIKMYRYCCYLLSL